MNWRCCLGLNHRMKWSARPFRFGYTAFQRGRCERCGKLFQREVGWTNAQTLQDDDEQRTGADG